MADTRRIASVGSTICGSLAVLDAHIARAMHHRTTHTGLLDLDVMSAEWIETAPELVAKVLALSAARETLPVLPSAGTPSLRRPAFYFTCPGTIETPMVADMIAKGEPLCRLAVTFSRRHSSRA